jgi:ABC-2 type transport system permease protein
MRKAMIIARREYQTMVRAKAFLISLLLMPVMMSGAIFLQTRLAKHVDVSEKKIVVLDGTGKLFATLRAQAERRNQNELFDKKENRQTLPAILLEQGPPQPWTDDMRLTLSDRIRSHEIFAFVEIDPGTILPPAARDAASSARSVRMCTESFASYDVNAWLMQAINQTSSAIRIKKAGLDPAVVTALLAPLNVQNLAPYSRGHAGEIKKSAEGERAMVFFVPMGIMMLMFFSLMMVTQPMLTSVLEEKQQRIAEVLLGSASPFQIMMGKLIGIVAVAMTFVAIYALGGYFVAQHYGYAQLIPIRLVGWFVGFEILACLLFGAIFIAIGAACTEIKDAQSLLMPVMLVLVMPMMTWNIAMNEPLGSYAVWLSLFPPATPMLMMLRMAASPIVPMWQPILGMLLVVITTVICVFAAGRVLRIGLLMQGKAPKWHELLGWIARG